MLKSLSANADDEVAVLNVYKSSLNCVKLFKNSTDLKLRKF